MLTGEHLSRHHRIFGLEIVFQLPVALDDGPRTEAVTTQPGPLLSFLPRGSGSRTENFGFRGNNFENYILGGH